MVHRVSSYVIISKILMWGVHMLNEERVRLMTKMAMFEKREEVKPDEQNKE